FDDARDVLREDARQLLGRAAVIAAGLELPVVADADDVRPQVAVDIAARLRRGRGMRRRGGLELAQGHRCPQPRYPDVGAVLQPVVVADAGEAAPAPSRTPRVLQPEAAVVVGDDGEGMA